MAGGFDNGTRDNHMHRDLPAARPEATEQSHVRNEVSKSLSDGSIDHTKLGQLPSNNAAREAIAPMEIFDSGKQTKDAKPVEDKKWTESIVQKVGKDLTDDINNSKISTLSPATVNRMDGLLGNAYKAHGEQGLNEIEHRINDSFVKAQRDEHSKAPAQEIRFGKYNDGLVDTQIFETARPTSHTFGDLNINK